MTDPDKKQAQRLQHAYEKEVARALRQAGEDADAIALVLDGLREQIAELAGVDADVNAMQAALARMEPPQAFAKSAQTTEAVAMPSGLYAQLGTIGLGLSLLTPLVALIIGLGGGALYDAQTGADTGGMVYVLGELLALLCGLATWREKKGKTIIAFALALLLLLGLLSIM